MSRATLRKTRADSIARTAVEKVSRGQASREQALLALDPTLLHELLHPRFDPEATKNVVASGVPASPGAAQGKVVLTSARAEAWAEAGERFVLVREETCPEDVPAMGASQGILTVRGGRTSHAAVVAGQMGKPCVVGCSAVEIDEEHGRVRIGAHELREGDPVGLDGLTGEILLGDVAIVEPRLGDAVATLLKWADELRTLGVRANADTPQDARKARELGAEGIGVCRTEHMFFDKSRIHTMRQAILAEDDEERRRALAALLPAQRTDFLGLFREMDGLPVTIRLLDPPLHEFLPFDPETQVATADKLGMTVERLRASVRRLAEANPMLGLRGARLGVLHPEIYDMQVRAIVEAARLATAEGVTVQPEVMLPLIGAVRELQKLRERLSHVAAEVNGPEPPRVEIRIGTMIEVPRAALTADRIAQAADFFSFGTNDLTQMTYAVSRDDAEGTFLPRYVEEGLYEQNPFVTLDQEGVGRLIRMACELGRQTRPDLKLGVCGEHGGEPLSIEFFHQLGIDYVSCSPYRVPIARLAAAQAALRQRQARAPVRGAPEA